MELAFLTFSSNLNYCRPVLQRFFKKKDSEQLFPPTVCPVKKPFEFIYFKTSSFFNVADVKAALHMYSFKKLF